MHSAPAGEQRPRPRRRPGRYHRVGARPKADAGCARSARSRCDPQQGSGDPRHGTRGRLPGAAPVRRRIRTWRACTTTRRAPAALGRQVGNTPCAGRRWLAGRPGQRTCPRDRALDLRCRQHPPVIPAARAAEARAKARVIVGASHAPRLTANLPLAKEPWWHCGNAPMEAALTCGCRASLRSRGTVTTVDNPMCRH